jgi:SAM-dependent methyltransferase
VSGLPGLSAPLPPGALQEVACGLCGSTERRLKFKDGPFAVVTCTRCDLTYVTPRLIDAALIEQVYDEGYWSSDAAKVRGYTDYRADAPLYLRTYERRFEVVERHFPRPGRVLDIGCAAGYFLSIAQRRGWDVTGYEPSDAIRPEALARLGAGRVRGGEFANAGFEKGSFDLVTYWDVIEHIPDGVAALRGAAELLKPGGKLLIETQNVNSRAAKLLGPRWQHYKHAEHIYHYNPATIADLLGRAGFEILENTPWLGGKYVSMGFVAERAGRLHPVLSTLLKPLELIRRKAVYVNLFDEMIVVARPLATQPPTPASGAVGASTNASSSAASASASGASSGASSSASSGASSGKAGNATPRG